MTPETKLPKIIDEPILDDRDAPAEIDDRPPWPDDPDGPRFSFAEFVDQEAMAYKEWGNAVGDFLARQMDELAQLIRWTGATTPEEHEARMEVWNAEIRETWEARGYEAGRESCPCNRNPFE